MSANLFKGQSQVIQFILFFMIGLGVFLSISSFFRMQLDTFGKLVADSNRKLAASYFSAISIDAVVSCKECDNINTSIQLQNRTANFFLEVVGTSSGIDVRTQPGNDTYSSLIHNLAISLGNVEGIGSSVGPIVLSFNKNQNKLRVVQ
mgnify:CR=1 FL=1